MTTFSALPVMADIVVPPPTPPPRSVPSSMTIGVWPFMILAIIAGAVLIFSRRSRPLNRIATVPAEKG